MSFSSRLLVPLLAAGALLSAALAGEKPPTPPTPPPLSTSSATPPAPPAPAGCATAMNRFFEEEVWTKVVSQKCLTCHRKGGDAEESRFILLDPKKVDDAGRDEAMRSNRAMLTKIAAMKEKDKPRMLQKVVGELDHGGEDVLKTDSPAYRILAEFVKRANAPTPATLPEADPKAPPFFEGVVMLEDRRLLRRATLSLAGRLPTDAELAAVTKDGLKALPAVLDAVMKEDAFYDRLREGFNDIFLTLGIDGGEAEILSYEHFEKTRLWYQKPDLTYINDIKDPKERERAGWKLADEYRRDLYAEPMKLIEYIVRNDRSFTEIITADYIMVSPFSARGYGVYEQIKRSQPFSLATCVDSVSRISPSM